MGRVIRENQLTFEIELEEVGYAAHCIEIGTASCGDTEEEALRNVREATSEYIAYLRESGKLQAFLLERGQP
ncbi:MAG: type II toxin-antitoxin system HicB family antitoxin [Candidatus Hydrogenedentota bacterium]